MSGRPRYFAGHHVIEIIWLEGTLERVANVIEPGDHGVVVVGCWRTVSVGPARIAPVVAA
jgi:hypothetical protein